MDLRTEFPIKVVFYVSETLSDIDGNGNDNVYLECSIEGWDTNTEEFNMFDHNLEYAIPELSGYPKTPGLYSVSLVLKFELFDTSGCPDDDLECQEEEVDLNEYSEILSPKFTKIGSFINNQFIRPVIVE